MQTKSSEIPGNLTFQTGPKCLVRATKPTVFSIFTYPYEPNTIILMVDFNENKLIVFLSAIFTLLHFSVVGQPLLVNCFAMGSSGTDVAWSSIPDDSGNYYICGSFSGTVDFNPDKSAVYSLTSNGTQDAFIAKYDSLDHFVWAFQLGNATAAGEDASYITLDDQGNLFVGFDIAGTTAIDFDPTAGTTLITPTGRCAVYAKYNSSGGLEWAKKFDNCFVSYFEVDLHGNAILPLRYDGACDLDPGAGSIPVTLTGVKDAAMVKLDSSGNLVWSFTMASIGSDKIGGMDVDDDNSIYISGRLGGAGSYDLDPDTATSFLISGPSGYLAKYDENGAFMWAKADPNFNLTKLRINKAGQVVVGGSITGTVDLDLSTGPADTAFYSSNGDRDAFMATYDSADCSFIDAMTFGNILQDGVNSFVIDEFGYYYITGDVTDAVDFDPGPRQVILNNTGRNAYIAKFDEQFNLVWVEIYPFFLNGTSKGQMNVAPNQDIIIAASFTGNQFLDFDPPSINVKSRGGDDIVVARYHQLQPESIPTLGEWGMIILGIGTMMAGIRYIRLI